MTEPKSTDEAYEQIAELLKYLSKRGETVMLFSEFVLPDGERTQMISGYSGGVVWKHGKPFGEGWESYKEGN